MDLNDLLDEAQRAIDESSANMEPLYAEMAEVIERHIEEHGLVGISTAVGATRSMLVRLLSFMPDHIRERLMDGFEADTLKAARREGGALGIVEAQMKNMPTKAQFDEFVKAYEDRK